ncbi:hypothetical protein OAH05_02740, partial [bacterium]|nr:hypothetical protein [bacterium]
TTLCEPITEGTTIDAEILSCCRLSWKDDVRIWLIFHAISLSKCGGEEAAATVFKTLDGKKMWDIEHPRRLNAVRGPAVDASEKTWRSTEGL